MMRTALMAFTALCVASGAFAQSELAPLQNQGVRGAIPNRYIVVMKPSVSREAIGDIRQRITGMGGKVLHVYTSALNGFSVEISPEGLRLASAPNYDLFNVLQSRASHVLQGSRLKIGLPGSGVGYGTWFCVTRRWTEVDSNF